MITSNRSLRISFSQSKCSIRAFLILLRLRFSLAREIAFFEISIPKPLESGKVLHKVIKITPLQYLDPKNYPQKILSIQSQLIRSIVLSRASV